MSPPCSASAMKSAGGQETALRVPPAHERLHAHDPAAGGLGLRLEVELQLTGGDGVGQLGREREAVARVGVAVGGVQLVPAARELCLVHRHVGVAQQLLRRRRSARGRARSRRSRRRAGAGRRSRTAGAGRRRSARRCSPRRPRCRARRAARRTRRHRGARACRPRAARRSTRGPTWLSSTSPAWWPSVSFSVLEFVEVDDQQRERAAVGAGDGDRLLGPLREQAAVREPGEVVGGRLPADHRERPDVVERDRRADHRHQRASAPRAPAPAGSASRSGRR